MRLILMIILMAYLQLASAGNVFSLAGHQIEAGSVKSWVQSVADTTLPITVINGQGKGPVLTLTAGIHGDEFPAIFALQKFSKTIKPETLRGTLIIVHLANLEGFHGRRVALSPVDEKNLNRVFPGSADGTLTEKIGYFMTNELIAKTDYLIDIHSGSWNQTLLPHVYSPVLNNASLDKKTLDFAEALGIAHIVLYDERPNDPEHSISYPNTAQTRGKPALTLEVGQLGQSKSSDIELIYQACMNAVQHLSMLGSLPKKSSNVILYRKLVSIHSPKTGIFIPQVKVGDSVNKGQEIGWISDYFGHRIATLYATVAGDVLMQKETPPIREGETTTDIGIR
jgi:uncharacterized protein